MKFIVHTKYGTFHSKSVGATEEDYQEAQKLMEQLPKLTFFCLETEEGEVYMSPQLITDSIFILQK